MKHIYVFALLAALSNTAFAQNYWQQEVNYTIAVKLNDKNHTLSAFEEFEYINNSPNQLDFLYIHLWPNAYQNEKTALGKQQWNSGEMLLKYGDDSLKGNISDLDFKINGEAVKWELDSKNIEVMLVGDLNQGYLQQLIAKVESLIQKKISYQIYSTYEFQIQKTTLLNQAHLHLFGEA